MNGEVTAARSGGMTVAEFIEARLGEDAEMIGTEMPADFSPSCSDFYGVHLDPARALRQVTAMRAILALHPPEPRSPHPQCEGCSQEWWPCQTLEHLAAIWSDHPDYDEEWRP